jgi:hypothetical protein
VIAAAPENLREVRASLYATVIDTVAMFLAHAVDHIRALAKDMHRDPVPIWSPLTLCRARTRSACSRRGGPARAQLAELFARAGLGDALGNQAWAIISQPASAALTGRDVGHAHCRSMVRLIGWPISQPGWPASAARLLETMAME